VTIDRLSPRQKSSLASALTHCYPEDVYRHLGIRLRWLDVGDHVEVKIEDQYGRTSVLAITSLLLAAGKPAVIRDEIEAAVEWHLEPPPFYVP